MARKLGNIVATLENLEQQEALANAQEGVQAQETATEVAEVNADLDNDVGDIEQTDTAIDDGEAAVSQLDELSEVASDSLVGEGETVEEGEEGQEGPGLTEGEATMVEITHETIMKNLGIPYTRQTYTSESFAQGSSRRQTTRNLVATLEDAKEGIGSKIMSALKAAFDMVIGFIAKIINNRKLMEKHLTNLEAKVKAMAEGKPKEATLSAGAAQLSINGKADAKTAILTLDDVSTNLNMAKTAAELLHRVKEAGSGFDLGAKLDAAIKALPVNGSGVGNLGGGKAFKFTGHDKDVTMDTVASSGLNVEVIEVSKAAESIAAPTKAEMLTVLAAAKKALTSLREVEGIGSRLKNFVEGVKINLAKAGSVAAGAVGSEKAKSVGAFIDVVKLGRKVMSKILTVVFSNSFKTIKAAADYVAAGIKNLGGEGEKPTEQAA